MATPFDSFNRSPLGGFIQSPLKGRGAPLDKTLSVSLVFSLTPTPTFVKYPIVQNIGTSTQYWQRWQEEEGNLNFVGSGTLSGGGNLSIRCGKEGISNTWSVYRQKSQLAIAPFSFHPDCYFRVRINATPEPSPIAASVYMAPEGAPCDFYGPSGGSYLGIAYPGVDTYFDPGNLSPGERFYLFFACLNDLDYIDIGVQQGYAFSTNFQRLETRL